MIGIQNQYILQIILSDTQQEFFKQEDFESFQYYIKKDLCIPMFQLIFKAPISLSSQINIGTKLEILLGRDLKNFITITTKILTFEVMSIASKVNTYSVGGTLDLDWMLKPTYYISKKSESFSSAIKNCMKNEFSNVNISNISEGSESQIWINPYKDCISFIKNNYDNIKFYSTDTDIAFPVAFFDASGNVNIKQLNKQSVSDNSWMFTDIDTNTSNQTSQTQDWITITLDSIYKEDFFNHYAGGSGFTQYNFNIDTNNINKIYNKSSSIISNSKSKLFYPRVFGHSIQNSNTNSMYNNTLNYNTTNDLLNTAVTFKVATYLTFYNFNLYDVVLVQTQESAAVTGYFFVSGLYIITKITYFLEISGMVTYLDLVRDTSLS